ncbi:MAG: TetR/AcrR family transcriptional regulator [OCS116 cluster bacterium]|nr:TetR/AcrR family transcriptional regulator [OCS116 cluster bacterium]
MAKILTEDQKQEKRRKLIELATSILERDGESGLTARGLAREAGISRTTPYLYFKDKEAILDGIRLQILDRIITKFKQVDEKHPLTQMYKFGEIYTVFGLDHPELYRLVFTSNFSLRPMTPELQQALDNFHCLMMSPMRKAYDDGLLRIPAERLNLVLWSCTHGLLSFAHSGFFEKEDVLSQLRQDIGQILSQGFLNPIKD